MNMWKLKLETNGKTKEIMLVKKQRQKKRVKIYFFNYMDININDNIKKPSKNVLFDRYEHN